MLGCIQMMLSGGQTPFIWLSFSEVNVLKSNQLVYLPSVCDCVVLPQHILPQHIVLQTSPYLITWAGNAHIYSQLIQFS